MGLLCLAKWKRGRGGEADIRPSVGGRWWDPYMATGQPGKKSSLTDLGILKLPTYEGTLQFLVCHCSPPNRLVFMLPFTHMHRA